MPDDEPGAPRIASIFVNDPDAALHIGRTLLRVAAAAKLV